MSLRIVDLPAFQALVKQIAAERPTYRYMVEGSDSCTYSPNHVNGVDSRCIIGEALHRLGIDDEILEEIDNRAGQEGEDVAAAAVLPKLGFSPEVSSWAQQVQTKQDNGMPWGEAVSL